MQQNDNWGWRARIGMFIVGLESVPEAEWWAMLPYGVSVHAARVTKSAPWAKWRDGRSDVELAEDLIRGCRQFAAMRLSAVVIGHSSSSFVGGRGWDQAARESLSGLLHRVPMVTTNGLDCIAALHAVNAKQPFLVLPPWFNDVTADAAHQYLLDHGFEPPSVLRYDPGHKWRHLPPESLYDNGMNFQQEVEPLYNQIRNVCPKNADSVLIAGTGFRCVGIIECLEQDLGMPVVSANQASLWHCLRSTGVRSEIVGYGSLLHM